MVLDVSRGGKEMGGVEGGEVIIKIYCKYKIIFKWNIDFRNVVFR